MTDDSNPFCLCAHCGAIVSRVLLAATGWRCSGCGFEIEDEPTETREWVEL